MKKEQDTLASYPIFANLYFEPARENTFKLEKRSFHFRISRYDQHIINTLYYNNSLAYCIVFDFMYSPLTCIL